MEARLLQAIENEDLPVIEDMFRNKGVNINALVYMKNTTSLGYSIIKEKYKSFQKILELGADINKGILSEGLTAYTPLMLAVKREDPRFTTDLIQKGADVNMMGDSTLTPLMAAYELNGGTEENIIALLDAGANIDTPAYLGGKTVLFEAITRASQYDSIHWLKLLFENGRTPNVNYQTASKVTPVMEAIDQRNKEAVEFLISKGADLELRNNFGYNALFHGITMGVGTDILEILINAGAKTSIEIKGLTRHALSMCIYNGAIYNDTIKLLLEKGVDPNAIDDYYDQLTGNSALINAVRKDFDYDIIKLLIEKGGDVNYKNNNDSTPLIMLMDTGQDNVEIVNLLIEKGADLDVKNEIGDTALIFATMNGLTKTVKILIENGADVNASNYAGDTPLLYAVSTLPLELIKLLIEKGADVNAENENKQTVLFLATSNDINADIVEIVKLLINKGADVDAQDEDNGYSPLINAVIYNNIEVVKLLLEAGAHRSLRDNYNATALDYATDNENEELIALLSEGSAKVETGEMWKGYTKADAEFFNPILDNTKNLNDQSICPFCLRYVEREEGTCKYMSHPCPLELRHERLYNLYKNSEGKVTWCTVCGRHCYGHGHFPLTDTTETTRPDLIPAKPGANVYDPKSCPLEGGGGPDEKIKRIDGLLRYVCEVQEDVGKRLAKKVRDELIEETWKAASSRAPKTVREIRAAKKFNIPCGLTSISSADAESPDVPNPNPLPTEKGPGTSSISLDDCDQTYEFVHKQPDGTMFTHQLVCKDDIRELINNSGGTENKCPIEPECKGVLHPEEIKTMFADDEEFYTNYKKRFNDVNKVGGRKRKQSRRKTYRNKKFRGGADDGTPIMSRMTDATCALPEKKVAGRRTYKKKPKSRRVTKRHL